MNELYNKGCASLEQGDYNKAVEYLTAAADAGYVEAQYRLGMMYRKGEGIAKDVDKAALLLFDAAVQGHGIAQYIMGKCYLYGDG
ncbi:MAG: sel1 repeat family protein, partial [Alistipes sp.]|nr:sel1 repeat family protein [Alistipes sp.]